MTLARTHAVALTGLEGQVVEVQCDISAGLPGLYFTGLPDASVSESRDRLRAAVHNCGGHWPNQRVTVALLPADVRKVGSRFDLAVGMAVLAASEQVPAAAVMQAAWIAELGLDGRLRPVRGVLPSVLAAREAGLRRVVVAAANAAEASLVSDMDVRCADRLAEIVEWLTGDGPALPTSQPPSITDEDEASRAPDLADVAGQHLAKHALAVAAAGGHHLYLVGTPGAGKTMLAERLPGLLPPLTEAQSLEVTAVHSIAGLLGEQARLVARPPIQSPHHTASVAALVGGGSNIARPGAISLAHHGVLFLDEAPEFNVRALDALRQPLETGRVVLARGGGSVIYPARFQLVLAANPCACGNREKDCVCLPAAKRRHGQRLSGPLLDRIDLRIQIDPVPHADLFASERVETTGEVAARVLRARTRAADRLAGTGWHLNAEVPGSTLRRHPFAPPRSVTRQAEFQLEQGILSARGYDRVLRLAWTLADLADRDAPSEKDIAEALYFRTGEASAWAA